MALSHKELRLPSLRIGLAEIDIESGLDFRIPASKLVVFCSEKVTN